MVHTAARGKPTRPVPLPSNWFNLSPRMWQLQHHLSCTKLVISCFFCLGDSTSKVTSANVRVSNHLYFCKIRFTLQNVSISFLCYVSPRMQCGNPQEMPRKNHRQVHWYGHQQSRHHGEQSLSVPGLHLAPNLTFEDVQCVFT